MTDVRCPHCGELNRKVATTAPEPPLCRRCGKPLVEPPSARLARDRLLGESPLARLPLRKAATPWPPEAAQCELPPPRAPRPLPTPAPLPRPRAAPFPVEAAAPRPRRRRRRGSFVAGLFWFVGSLGLVGLAAAQAVWQRPQLLDLHPALRPLAERGCAEVGCALPARRDPSAFAIVASGLEPVPEAPGVAELHVRLRNDAPFAQALPRLRLTLIDDAQRPLGRRTLAATDYLPSSDTDLPAGTEVEGRALLEIAEPDVSGFQVELVGSRGQSR